MVLKTIIALLSLLFYSSLLKADSCGNEIDLKNKINLLRLEVACTGGQSIIECSKLINGYSPENDHIDPESSSDVFFDSDLEIRCNSNFSMVLPLNHSIQTLSKEVHSAAQKLKLVNSLEEFYEHTRLHRERVKVLGLELFKSHPELFKGLTQAQVTAVLNAHDMAKMNPRNVSPDGRPFYRSLYDSFGKKLDRETIDALNSQDKALMEKARAYYGIEKSPDLKAKMERIEKIADLVDRGMSKVSPEEFGRPMEIASKFLKDEDDIKLARELESKYKSVTQKLTYKHLSAAQLKSVSSKILIEEHFLKLKPNASNLELSARVLFHSALSKGKNALSTIFEFLASKKVSLALKVANIPMLYFASMDSLGCSGSGYHDWVKDPDCKPAIGLTPKIINFLNEPWEIQKNSLENEGRTCDVVDKIYQQSISSPKIISCKDNALEIELPSGDRFDIVIDEKNQLRQVNMRDLASHSARTPHGMAHNVIINSSGEIEKVCYQKNPRLKIPLKCLNTAESPMTKNVTEIIYGLNYQIHKAIACCRKMNPDIKFNCVL